MKSEYEQFVMQFSDRDDEENLEVLGNFIVNLVENVIGVTGIDRCVVISMVLNILTTHLVYSGHQDCAKSMIVDLNKIIEAFKTQIRH